jgi:hypothetical protein
MWADEDGQVYESLVDIEFQSIQSFRLYNFYFKFGEMTLFDKVSILMKVQSYYDCRVFNPFDFADYLALRKIDYKLYFIPALSSGAMENLLNLKAIMRINWRILRQKMSILGWSERG